MNRRAFLIAAPTVVLLTAGVVQAGGSKVFAPGGVAINGIDPVSYFTDGRPVPGDERFALMWMGATWLFASAENREIFESDPHRYAPAFGGYCAYSVSRGYTAASSPEAWTIHDGKLFLTYSDEMRARWASHIETNIAKGRANWPDLRDGK